MRQAFVARHHVGGAPASHPVDLWHSQAALVAALHQPRPLLHLVPSHASQGNCVVLRQSPTALVLALVVVVLAAALGPRRTRHCRLCQEQARELEQRCSSRRYHQNPITLHHVFFSLPSCASSPSCNSNSNSNHHGWHNNRKYDSCFRCRWWSWCQHQ